jgi:uncharacterized membrane protein
MRRAVWLIDATQPFSILGIAHLILFHYWFCANHKYSNNATAHAERDTVRGSETTSGTNYEYPLGPWQAIWLCGKARGGKIVDYLTDEQRSYADKAPVELGSDLQFGPLGPALFYHNVTATRFLNEKSP